MTKMQREKSLQNRKPVGNNLPKSAIRHAAHCKQDCHLQTAPHPVGKQVGTFVKPYTDWGGKLQCRKKRKDPKKSRPTGLPTTGKQCKIQGYANQPGAQPAMHKRKRKVADPPRADKLKIFVEFLNLKTNKSRRMQVCVDRWLMGWQGPPFTCVLCVIEGAFVRCRSITR